MEYNQRNTIGFFIITWIEEYLKNVDGEQFQLTKEQLLFILEWYRVEDNLQFKYNHGVLRRSKGQGKSELAAALSLAELCAPVIPTSRDKQGNILAQPQLQPEVCIAGVSREQTAHTFKAALGQIANSHAIYEYNLDVKQTRIRKGLTGLLSRISCGARTQEGSKPTFYIVDETQHWYKSNQGHELYEVILRSVAKKNARILETTNAHIPGMDSVAERTYLAYQKAKEKDKDLKILYSSIEAPASTNIYDAKSLKEGLKIAYGDAYWAPIDRFIDEINNPRNDISQSRRFYLNQIVSPEDFWISIQKWDACLDNKITLTPGDEIVLGFDGARTTDSTAIVALRTSDMSVFLIKLWEKPAHIDKWHIDMTEVDETISYLFEKYSVLSFLSDVKEWETFIDKWNDKFLLKLKQKSIAYDMRANLKDTAIYLEKLYAYINDKKIKHDGNPILRNHVANAKRRLNRYGASFGKENRESIRKVDALAAMLLAFIAYEKFCKNTVKKKYQFVGFN